MKHLYKLTMTKTIYAIFYEEASDAQKYEAAEEYFREELKWNEIEAAEIKIESEFDRDDDWIGSLVYHDEEGDISYENALGYNEVGKTKDKDVE